MFETASTVVTTVIGFDDDDDNDDDDVVVDENIVDIDDDNDDDTIDNVDEERWTVLIIWLDEPSVNDLVLAAIVAVVVAMFEDL